MAICDVCGNYVRKTRLISGINFCDECFSDLSKLRAGDPETVAKYQREETYKNTTAFVRDYLKSNIADMDDNDKSAYEENHKADEEKRQSDFEAMKRISELEAETSKYKIFSISGARGRHIDVYPYKLNITTSVTVGSVLTKNATDGTKTIYFCDIIGIQFKKPGLTIGYIQFETAGGNDNHPESNWFSENTFTYETLTPEIQEVYLYILNQLDAYKSRVFKGER